MKKPASETESAVAEHTMATEKTPTILAPWLELFEQLTRHVPRVVVWRGALRFPDGGVAQWRAKMSEHHDEKVSALLDRFRVDVETGRRWLSVNVENDDVEVLGWDWREDWEDLNHRLAGTLEAAASLAPEGRVEVFARASDGECRWVTYDFDDEELVIDEGETDFEADDLRAALTAVGPAFNDWLSTRPETRARYEHAGKYGYIDRSGREIIPLTRDRAFEFNDGLATIKDATGYHLIDVRGEALPGSFAMADYFMRGLAPVSVGSDKFGYVDGTGTMRIAPSLCAAGSFRGPLAIVSVGAYPNRTQRFMTTSGALVGDPFDYTTGFAEDLAFVYRHDLATYGCIDAKGEPAFAKRFGAAGVYAEGLAAVREVDALKFGYADREGNFVISPRFDEAHPFSEGRAVVRLDKVFHLIDRDGSVVGAPFDGLAGSGMSEGMIAVRIDGKIGFMDERGVLVIGATYEDGHGFFEGMAYVSVKANGDTFWGHIGRDGAFVIEPVLEWTNRFNDGLAPAKAEGLFGFIDTRGAWVVPPRYKTMQPRFNDGLAWVQLP